MTAAPTIELVLSASGLSPNRSSHLELSCSILHALSGTAFANELTCLSKVTYLIRSP